MANKKESKFEVTSVEVQEEKLVVKFLNTDGEERTKTYVIQEKKEELAKYFSMSEKNYAFNDINEFVEAGTLIDLRKFKESIMGIAPEAAAAPATTDEVAAF